MLHLNHRIVQVVVIPGVRVKVARQPVIGIPISRPTPNVTLAAARPSKS